MGTDGTYPSSQATEIRRACLQSAAGFLGRPPFRGASEREVSASRPATKFELPTSRELHPKTETEKMVTLLERRRRLHDDGELRVKTWRPDTAGATGRAKAPVPTRAFHDFRHASPRRGLVRFFHRNRPRKQNVVFQVNVPVKIGFKVRQRFV